MPARGGLGLLAERPDLLVAGVGQPLGAGRDDDLARIEAALELEAQVLQPVEVLDAAVAVGADLVQLGFAGHRHEVVVHRVGGVRMAGRDLYGGAAAEVEVPAGHRGGAAGRGGLLQHQHPRARRRRRSPPRNLRRSRIRGRARRRRRTTPSPRPRRRSRGCPSRSSGSSALRASAHRYCCSFVTWSKNALISDACSNMPTKSGAQRQLRGVEIAGHSCNLDRCLACHRYEDIAAAPGWLERVLV